MKTRNQVRHQLKQVVFRHLQRKLRSNFHPSPDTCKHNTGTAFGDGVLHVCGFIPAGEQAPRGVLCDPRVSGCNEMARSCPLWEPRHTKEEIQEDFRAFLRASDRGTVARHYPDIAALMWVLDEGQPEEDLIGDTPPAPETPPETAALQPTPAHSVSDVNPTLWERLLLWWGGS